MELKHALGHVLLIMQESYKEYIRCNRIIFKEELHIPLLRILLTLKPFDFAYLLSYVLATSKIMSRRVPIL